MTPRVLTTWRVMAGLVAAAALSACLTDFGPPPGPGPACGDGNLGPDEACDDGNRDAGDGCNGLCQVEPGWSCPATGGACAPVCGDELVVGNEACDGWNLDGATCTQLGYEGGTLLCTSDCADVDVTHCYGYCGDGSATGDEACDGDDLAGQTCQDQGFYEGTLACLSECQGFDTSGCELYCGDGLINGGEVCDGDNLNGRSCLTLGTFGGELGCQPDCQGFDTSGCHQVPRILINEVALYLQSYIELVNGSAVAVDLDGFQLEVTAEADNHATTVTTLTLPAYSLPPGDRVTLYDSPIDGTQDPVVGDGTIAFDRRFGLWRQPAALQLRTAGGAPTDFLRWGDATVAPPTGTAWSDTPDPLRTFLSVGWAHTLSRLPDGADTDIAGDFCIAAATEGAPNTAICLTPAAPGDLWITEVDTGWPDGLELHNPGGTAVDLLDWAIEGTDPDDAWQSDTLPSFSLAPGAYVKIVADLNDVDPYVQAGVVHIRSMGWQSGGAGACWLVEPIGRSTVDAVRWAGATYPRYNFSEWQDTPAALPAPSYNTTLGRASGVDTNTAADWCLQSESLGSANGACQ